MYCCCFFNTKKTVDTCVIALSRKWERKMDLKYIYLCISRESKLFLSLLIFVLGSKDIDSWCLSTCSFSVIEPRKNRKQFHVSLPCWGKYCNFFFFLINDLSNPNGLKYWEYRIYWFIILTFAHTDKTSTIKDTFIHGTNPLYMSIILD